MIIEVHSIEINDFVSFIEAGNEFFGMVVAECDEFWTVEIATPSGAVNHHVVADQITDIM